MWCMQTSERRQTLHDETHEYWTNCYQETEQSSMKEKINESIRFRIKNKGPPTEELVHDLRIEDQISQRVLERVSLTQKKYMQSDKV